MKTSFISASMLLLIFTLVISGCSKKSMTVNKSNSNIYSQQLENNATEKYTAEASTSDDKTTSASSKSDIVSTHINSSLKTNVSNGQSKNMIAIDKEKLSGKNSLLTKILIRKIEKSMKKQNLAAPQEATGPLRTGIILGAVGLLLLITAGFFGPASPLIYVSGAVLFVVGVVLILVSVL